MGGATPLHAHPQDDPPRAVVDLQDDTPAQRITGDNFEAIWQAVQDLDDDDYHIRRHAAETLVEARLDQRVLEGLLIAPVTATGPYALSTQQKHELLNVLTRPHSDGPRRGNRDRHEPDVPQCRTR